MRAVRWVSTRARILWRLDGRRARAVALGVISALVVLAVFWSLASVTTANRQRQQDSERSTFLLCTESNRLRDAERGLWELIIKLSAQNPNPRVSKATQEKQIAQFRAYLNSAFGHIDCKEPQSLGKPSIAPATIAFPVVTRVETNTKTRTRTVYITVPGPTTTKTKTVTRTVVVCRLPNGKPC